MHKAVRMPITSEESRRVARRMNKELWDATGEPRMRLTSYGPGGEHFMAYDPRLLNEMLIGLGGKVTLTWNVSKELCSPKKKQKRYKLSRYRLQLGQRIDLITLRKPQGADR